MPRSRWSIIFAIVGLALGGNVQPINNRGSSQGSAAERKENENPKAPRIAPRAQQVGAPDVARENERHAAEERQRGRDDLVAQQETAFWTRIMGMVGVAALGLSAVGIWLIYTTFKETRRGAEAARESVIAFKELERPRLIPALSGADPTPDAEHEGWLEFTMQIPFTNAGRASANVVGLAVALIDSGAYREGMAVEPVGRVVNSGDTIALWSLAFDWDITRAHVGGFVIYRSSFGEHRTYFCYRLEPDPDVEGIWLRAEKGDDWPSDT